jgi:acyl-CoA reductase-like NAD-dependent aldehyde dehydrogenase
MERLSVPKMYKLFIGGKFTRTESERYVEVKNPSTGEKLCNISWASRKDLRNAVEAARTGFTAWSGKTAYERGQILYRLAEMLEGRKEQFTDEIKRSTTLRTSEARKEVERSIDRIIYFAGFCDKWSQLSGTVNPVQEGYFNFSIPEPTGITGIVLPDEPSFISLVSRMAVVLTAGNSCVILASDTAPLPALSFAEVISTSDVPASVVNILTGKKDELIPHLAGHFDVNAIDYADTTGKDIKRIKELCANNVKRFHSVAQGWNWFNDNQNESLYEIEKFTEIKTVWHTMGM